MLQEVLKRISDCPYDFPGWNLVSSFGSIISVIATGLFPQIYRDILQVLLDRASPSIEWAINSPPKPHAFVSLPLQSVLGPSDWFILNIEMIRKVFSWVLHTVIVVSQVFFCIELFSHISLIEYCNPSPGATSTGESSAPAGDSAGANGATSTGESSAPSAGAESSTRASTPEVPSDFVDSSIPTQSEIASCEHNFSPIQDRTLLGVACDFGGPGNHTAVTTADTAVHYCRDCFAICCNDCYVGD